LDTHLLIEMLDPVAKRRNWPSSPVVVDGELFSSWVRRAAVSFGVAPRNFLALIPSGFGWKDIDREYPADALRQLARLARRPYRALGKTLLRPPKGELIDCDRANLHAVLARSGKLLLESAGPRRFLLQYCPRCLHEEPRAWFRREWRFAHIVACPLHFCRLWDRCWECLAPVRPLAEFAAGPDPACSACGALLFKADAVGLPRRVVMLQTRLEELLGWTINRRPHDREVNALIGAISALPGAHHSFPSDGPPLRRVGVRARARLFLALRQDWLRDLLISKGRVRPQDLFAHQILTTSYELAGDERRSLTSRGGRRPGRRAAP
jgi:hypothetical protein